MTDCAHRRKRGGFWEDQQGDSENCAFPIAFWNTWSNVAYPLVGVVLVRLHLYDPTAWAFALLLTYLGYGSWRYHGRKETPDAQVDYAGMYAVFIGLATLAVLGMVPGRLLAPLMVVFGGFGAWYLAYKRWMKVNLNLAMAFTLLIASVGAWLVGSKVLMIASLVLFAVSYILWNVDKRIPLWGMRFLVRTPPLTGRLGHACWHAGTAIALGLMFLAVV